MSKIRIHVTKEDIQETRQGDPRACMVWRAVTRDLQLESGTGSTPTNVEVHNNGFVEFHGRKGVVKVHISENTTRNITNFDKDKSLVEPFNFDLDLPDDWREQIHGGAK